MEITVFCGIYLAELVCYQVGLRILFEVKKKTNPVIIMGVIASMIVGGLPIKAVGKNVLITAIVMVVVFFSMEGKAVEKAVKIAFILLFVCILEDMFLSLGKNVFGLQELFSISQNERCLFTKSCAALCMGVFFWIKQKIQFHKRVHVSSVIYLIIGMVSGAMLFCLSVLNYSKSYMNNARYIMLCNVLNIAIHISIFLLMIFVIYIKNTHEQMQNLLETEQLLKESQVNYYRQLLKKEEDTRKYRHDMNNHLMYLKKLLDDGHVMDAMTYLEQVQGGFFHIQKTYYVTGNEMIDAIMNYFFGMLPEDIQVLIPVKIPVEFEIEDADICTIFSNLFENMVEEIQYYSLKNAKIEILLEKGRDYVKYELKNTMHEMNNKENNENGILPLTSKKDKKNHGIGLSNVKNVVEKNHGKFSWSREENVFCVCIILPLN